MKERPIPQAVRTINAYLRLRAEKGILRKEFWTNDRIEYLRQLSDTGKAVVRSLHEAESLVPGSRSIRDRIVFQPLNRERESTESPDTRVRLTNGKEPISLSVPVVWGDMSFGAIHAEAVKALVRSAEATGILSGTGEGGLHPDIRHLKRFNVQWASARFGVTLDTLKSGSAIFIKIGQGAKPGIGGHLPGEKVVGEIPSTRRIPEGRDAISPAPHHDIYSIEDLGQRIWALKEATGQPVFVKVAATNYVPYVACGIARMGADGVVIDGHLAGTGATPEVIRDNVGIPIELAVASADRMLREQFMDGEPLRKRVSIIAGGGITSAADILRILALGADAAMMGTGALVATGCVMVHKCHTGKCPTALATQTPHRLLDTDWATEKLINLVHGLQEELTILLNELNVDSASDIIGNRDILRGFDMNDETLRILGIQPTQRKRAGMLPVVEEREDFGETLWTPWRREHLGKLAESGEAVITSMGSQAPPFVEPPRFLVDWIRSDGAQVTRPSIDPYREEIETGVYLADGRIRLAYPVFFDLTEFGETDVALHRLFVRTAAALGTVSVTPYGVMSTVSRLARGAFVDVSAGIREVKPEQVAKATGIILDDPTTDTLSAQIFYLHNSFDKPVFVRILSERGMEKRVRRAARAGADGVILVERALSEGYHPEASEDFLPLEIAVSQADVTLRETWNGSKPYRRNVSLLAHADRIRGAEDIFKLVTLGADAVGLSDAAFIAAFDRTHGEFRQDPHFTWDAEESAIRLENFTWGIQKELKLLLGAAGTSSVTTVISSRELIRSIDLDPKVRDMLGVKPAGV